MGDGEKPEQLQSELQGWEERHQGEFASEAQREFATETGIPVKRLYTPLDLGEFDYSRDVGFPGEYPYTRGITATGYRSQLWNVSQYTGGGTPEETNAQFRRMLEFGNSPHVACDLPTQLGLDVDDPLAHGEVGMAGVTLKSLRDWELLFDGIPLEKASVYTVANANAAVVLAMHVVLAEKQGADLTRLRGGLQNDILKEFAARGNYIFPVGPSMRLVADVMAFCAEHLPEYNPISVSGGHYLEAGADRIQEAAFALGDAIAYMDALVARGCDVNRFARNMYFLMKINHYDLFEVIAKFRALRRMWPRIVSERYGARDERSLQFRALVAGSGSQLTRNRTDLNIVRETLSCVSGVLSGVQKMDLKTLDEVHGIPSQRAKLTAIGTQHVVQYETGMHATIDPLAGSYFVESLTNEFEKRVWAELDRIEKMGGMPRAIERGYVGQALEEVAYKHQRDLETGRRVRVGLNKFVLEEEDPDSEVFRPQPDEEQRQIQQLQELKRNRDNAAVQAALAEVRRVALLPESNESNLVPPIMEAVKAYATNGEIHGVLREVFGEYRPR